jgi:excisionase family DNA binding protein
VTDHAPNNIIDLRHRPVRIRTGTTSPADHIPAEHRLYRIDDVAAALSFSRAMVYQLINSGRLHTVHEGRAVRIPGTAVADYINRLKREAGVA